MSSKLSKQRREHLQKATQLSAEKRARNKADKENLDLSARAAATRSQTKLNTENESLKETNAQLRSALKDLKQTVKDVRQKSDSHRRSKNRYQQELTQTRAELAVAVDPAREQAFSLLSEANSTLSQQADGLRHTCEAQRREIKRFRVNESRFTARLNREVNKAVTRATTIDLKVKGKVPHRFRALARDLTSLGVPTKKVFNVVRTCAKAFGLTLSGSFSHGLVSLTIKEGGAAADMQIADALLHNADGKGLIVFWLAPPLIFISGVTYSSDGTSDKGHHFQAHLLNVKQHDGNARTYTLGVQRQFSHTAEANFDTWITRTGTIWASWNLSKRGCTEQMLAEYFLCLLTGGQGDHNSGEKKMFRIMEAAHSKAVLTQLGRDILKVLPDWDHMALVSTAIDAMIVSLGGSSVWASLSEEEREQHRESCLEALAHDLGVKRFADLPPEKQASLRFFAWAGCAMHKELNSVVGGEQGMRDFWETSGLPGPLKLYNKDNASAARSGDSAAKTRADNVSQAGGAKMVTLLGTLVRNKDPKKGYQRNFNTYMRAKLHRRVQFPPIHQARFQSTGAAAGFTLLHLNILVTFLELMRDKKVKSIEFNNLEENVHRALNDPPTLSEAAVHALYHLATSQPYVKEARVAGKRAQDLGPLHSRVKEHCRGIIADPDLFLLAPADRSYIRATLNGEPYANPEVVEAILALHHAGRLPYLRELIVAFYTGALAKWEPFTSEFASDSLFSTASEADLARAPLKATNDDAESEFARLRHARRKASNITDDTFNCQDMYHMNETSEYIDKMPPEQQDELLPLGRARELAQRQRRDADVEVGLWEQQATQNVETHRIRGEEQRRAAEELTIWLDEFAKRRKTRIGDVTSAMLNAELNEELQYHRHRGIGSMVKEHPDAITHAPSWYKKKEDKLVALKKALAAELSHNGEPMDVDPPISNPIDVDFFNL